MSKTSKRKRGEKTNDGKEISEVDNQEFLEEKKKLLSEIRALRLLISQIENSLNTITFENVYKVDIDKIGETSKGHFNRPVDVDVAVQNELYSYAGLYCKKMGKDFIFAFQSFERNLCSNDNWIQLFKIEEHWRLGQWIMPMSVDIRAIIAKYSIDSAASMKLFLRECKHRIDCYNHREQDYAEVKAFLENWEDEGCSIESNYGYTRMVIKLSKANCASPDEARNILVYLMYKINEARPWKVQIDCEGENKLSDDEAKNMRVLFKSFKEQDLKVVAEKVLTTDGSPFFRSKALKDNSTLDEAEIEEVETSFSKILKKKPKLTKKVDKVAVEIDENENEVKENDDRRKNDLSIEVAARSDTQSGEEDVSQVETFKPRKKGSKRTKKSPIKRSSVQKNKVNSKVNNKSTVFRESGEKISPLKHRNDNVSNIVVTEQSDERSLKNDKVDKSIVPEMFKPKSRQSKRISEVNRETETSLRNPVKKLNKIEKSGRNTSANFAAMSMNRSHSQLMCSTPIAGRTIHLSAVAEENISAINRENTIVTKEIEAIKKNDASASDNLDESDSAESNGEDVTKIENSQRELLKDLQAIKYKATVTKKSVKRKAKSPLKGRKKIARK